VSASIAPALQVPSAAALGESFTMLLGRQVGVTDAGRVPPEGAIPAAVGPYVGEGERLYGCAWADLALSAAMGAAMAMADRNDADQCLTAGVLPTPFQDSLREILDVTARLLVADDGTAPQLRSVELLETGLADDTLALLADPRAGGYYLVDVPDYGSGLFSFTLD
jgi:hypothetical protein